MAFGIYDVQLNWGDAGLSCTGRLDYRPSEGPGAVWSEGQPFSAVPMLRLLKQAIKSFESPSDGILILQFSNGDRLTITPEDGFEAFTVQQFGKPIILE